MNVLISVDKLDNTTSKNVSFTNILAIPEEYGLRESTLSISFEGSLKKEENLFSLIGTIKGVLLESCSLCLRDIDEEFQIDYCEFFSNAEYSEEDENTLYFTGYKIDVLPSIISNVLLNIPLKPLCSNDCMGLCHTCGKNLNEDTCSCLPPIDSRLESLKDFFNN